MAKPLSAETLQAYQEDGVVCVRQAFGRNWIEHLRTCVAQTMETPGPCSEEYEAESGGGRFFGDLDLARRFSGFRNFIEQSPAAEFAGTVMKSSKANFLYDQLLVKEPGTTAGTPWHQDQPYWAVSGRQICSIWLPLDPILEETCVEYIAGSHRWPAYNPQHFIDGSPYKGTGLPALPDISARREDYDIRRWSLEPGDCLIFQAMIVHGAPGNASKNRRRALATRWTGDDARYCIRPGETGIPTRDPGLAHGDLMDCEDFPVLWRRQD